MIRRTPLFVFACLALPALAQAGVASGDGLRDQLPATDCPGDLARDLPYGSKGTPANVTDLPTTITGCGSPPSSPPPSPPPPSPSCGSCSANCADVDGKQACGTHAGTDACGACSVDCGNPCKPYPSETCAGDPSRCIECHAGCTASIPQNSCGTGSGVDNCGFACSLFIDNCNPGTHCSGSSCVPN